MEIQPILGAISAGFPPILTLGPLFLQILDLALKEKFWQYFMIFKIKSADESFKYWRLIEKNRVTVIPTTSIMTLELHEV